MSAQTNQPEQIFQIQKIYLKNASLESPHAPAIFMQEFQPALEVDLNVESTALDAENGIYHVAIRVTTTTKVGEEVAVLCEVEQAGIFTIIGYAEDEIAYLLGAQCPNVLFPYAREAISELVMRAGFPPLLLEPVNFDTMYLSHLEEQAQNAQ
ncbi:protein-export chaperone SecB [Galenea microaerophila]